MAKQAALIATRAACTECQRQVNLLTGLKKPHHAHPNRPYPRIYPPCDFQKSQDPPMVLA